jgi:hypothetical protein
MSHEVVEISLEDEIPNKNEEESSNDQCFPSQTSLESDLDSVEMVEITIAKCDTVSINSLQTPPTEQNAQTQDGYSDPLDDLEIPQEIVEKVKLQWKIIFIIFGFVGCGFLIPYHSFIVAVDYFRGLFGDSIEYYITGKDTTILFMILSNWTRKITKLNILLN